MSKTKEIYYCMACGKTHAKSSFYKSSNKFHQNGRLPMCKEAIRNYVNTGFDSVSSEKLQEILRQLDMPYVHNLLESAREDSRDTVGVYFSQINSLTQYKGKTWLDSEFPKESSGAAFLSDEDFEITDEMRVRWGTSYEPSELQFLEMYYNEYTSRLEDETPAELSLVKHVCVAELNAFKLSTDGTAKEYGEAVKVVTGLMKQLKLSPDQQKDLTENEESFGMFIKRIEDEEPIDQWDEQNSFASSVMDTFKFMIGHIGKMIGKSSPYDEEYNKIMEENKADSDGDSIE